MKTASFVTLAALATIAALPVQADGFDAILPGSLGRIEVLAPKGRIDNAFVMLSDVAGWGDVERALAKRLSDAGAMVVGVDLPALRAAVAANPVACQYLVGEIESIVHQAQRLAGNSSYRVPVLTGVRDGAALAKALAGQAPNGAFDKVIAVDPAATVSLAVPLCAEAPHAGEAVKLMAEFRPTQLRNPLDILVTQKGSPEGLAEAHKLQTAGLPVRVSRIQAADAQAVLEQRLQTLVRHQSARPAALTSSLPIVELPATGRHNVMAIFYSGDGGWRDIDEQLAGILQKKGVPTVGVDALRYFWSKKETKLLADDLAKLMDTYTQRWGIDQVILIGYSFGAGVLPAIYNALPDANKMQIAQISLLGLEEKANFEIKVGGWLGAPAGDDAKPTLPEVKLLPAERMQCVYGVEETDTVCPSLKGTPVEVIQLPGGHHYDGDYRKLARLLIDGATRRLGQPEIN
ncbi:virulence factor family protein [Lacibacterium aquatile]|uniref:Virulence factor family protein n=1 Tax=Lacibacterium aquatile TaxID=1168082 RepID=A0ABW5DSZ3_9PROT